LTAANSEPAGRSVVSTLSQRSAPEARYANRRILIDSAFVSGSSQLTGIPRVVFKYIENGYRYGRMHGVDVLPVYVSRDGVVDARYNLPSWAYEAPGFEGRFDGALSAIPVAQLEAFRLLQRRHLFARRLAAPVARILAVRLRFIGFDKLIEWLRSRYHRRMYQRALKIGALQEVSVRSGDILFMPAYWHDELPESYRDVQRKGALIVPLLHDVLPVTLPKSYNAGWREMFQRHVVEVARFCDHIMYVSAATRKDFLSVLSLDKVAEPPHSVRYHGSDFRLPKAGEIPKATSEMVRKFFSDPGFHLLMVGTIEPKKNHLAVLSACRALWERGIKFKLAIIGRPGWQSEAMSSQISTALRNRAWGENLAWFQNASDDDLEFAYSNSQLCILASDGEGFGLPLIEALARKVPVVASDIPIFREIGGEHVELFDLRTTGALTSTLEQLIADPSYYRAALLRASSFKWPSWESLSDQTFGELCQIAQRVG
jgi:glycosyltransferase involved in cell wall biosynthesis